MTLCLHLQGHRILFYRLSDRTVVNLLHNMKFLKIFKTNGHLPSCIKLLLDLSITKAFVYFRQSHYFTLKFEDLLIFFVKVFSSSTYSLSVCCILIMDVVEHF